MKLGVRALNLTLIRSWHALAALVAVAGALGALFALDAVPGRGPGSDRGFLLYSGWASLGLFLVVMAYVLRKYMHRFGYSPEFGMRRTMQQLEAAERRLNELRSRLLRANLGSRAEVQAEVDRILREEDVGRIVRADVLWREDERAGTAPTLQILTRPTEPMGRLARWLHAHAYYGLAALLLVALHAGTTPATPMAWLLWVGTALVVATGLLGIALWARGPTWLTNRERGLGLTIELGYALEQVLERNLAVALESVDEQARQRLQRLSAKPRAAETLQAVRDALEPTRTNEQRTALRDALVLIGQRRQVRSRLRVLRSVHRLFMAWRFVHVPLAWLFLGVVALHVLAVWRY